MTSSLHRLRLPALIAMLIFVLGVSTPAVNAASSANNDMPYSITIMAPQNQHAGIRGYFDLDVQPGAEQTVYLAVSNSTNQDIALKSAAVNGLTATSGGAVYVQGPGSDSSRLISSDFAVSQFISLPGETIVPAKGTVKLPVTIHVPRIDQGTYLGGIQFTTEKQADAQSTSANAKTSFDVSNRVARVIAIQLNLPKQVTPSFEFGGTGLNVYPSGAYAYVEMRNPTASLLQKVQGTYRVSLAGNTIMTGEFGPFMMTPGSQIHYPIKWTGAQASPGTYDVDVTGSANQVASISATLHFTVSAAQTKAIKTDQPNAATIAQTETVNNTSVWQIVTLTAVGTVLLLAFIGLIVVVARRRVRHHHA